MKSLPALLSGPSRFSKKYSQPIVSHVSAPPLMQMQLQLCRNSSKYYLGRNGESCGKNVDITSEPVVEFTDYIATIKRGSREVGFGLYVAQSAAGRVLIKKILPTLPLIALNNAPEGKMCINDQLIGVANVNTYDWPMKKVLPLLNQVPVNSDVRLVFRRYTNTYKEDDDVVENDDDDDDDDDDDVNEMGDAELKSENMNCIAASDDAKCSIEQGIHVLFYCTLRDVALCYCILRVHFLNNISHTSRLFLIFCCCNCLHRVCKYAMCFSQPTVRATSRRSRKYFDFFDVESKNNFRSSRRIDSAASALL